MKFNILILFLLPSLVFGQGWERTYGSAKFERGLSVKQTLDGGYIITGTTNSEGAGLFDVYLIKTNSNGDALWSQTYGGEKYDEGYSVQQTIDGGFIVAGVTKSFGHGKDDIYLIKTDSDGDTLWTKTYGGDKNDLGYSVQQTADGGYIIAGYTYSFGKGLSDIYLIKTDGIGDTIWTKTFGGEDIDKGHSVQETENGGFVISGYTSNYGTGLDDVYLIRTDKDGNAIWTKTFGGDNTDFGLSVQQTFDKGFIITGFKGYGNNIFDAYLIKTNETGDTLWTKTYGCECSVAGQSVQQTNDGGYIFTGRKGYFNDYDVYLVKTNSTGDTLWTKTFGSNANDEGYCVQQTTDGGYIISGYTETYDIGNVYLIKTDENGSVLSTSEIPLTNPNRKLLRLIDMSGRELPKPINNLPYIEIYDDGTIEKKMTIK